MKRTSFILSLLTFGLYKSAAAQTTSLQRLLNPPKCPVCGTKADQFQPITLLVAGDNGVIDASTLTYPVVICPKDGILFCVQAQ